MGRPKAEAGADGKKRRKKDPNRPKRPTSAYFYFLEHCRKELANAGGSITRIGEFTKQCSEKWKCMVQDERKPFDEQASSDKARYDREMATFKPPKDPNLPKRPQSAYFLFLADFRELMKNGSIPHKEILRQAGERWNQMSEELKRPYDQKADQLRQDYEQQMHEYRRKQLNNPQAIAAQIAQITNLITQQQQQIQAAQQAQSSSMSSPQPSNSVSSNGQAPAEAVHKPTKSKSKADKAATENQSVSQAQVVGELVSTCTGVEQQRQLPLQMADGGVPVSGVQPAHALAQQHGAAMAAQRGQQQLQRPQMPVSTPAGQPTAVQLAMPQQMVIQAQQPQQAVSVAQQVNSAQHQQPMQQQMTSQFNLVQMPNYGAAFSGPFQAANPALAQFALALQQQPQMSQPAQQLMAQMAQFQQQQQQQQQQPRTVASQQPTLGLMATNMQAQSLATGMAGFAGFGHYAAGQQMMQIPMAALANGGQDAAGAPGDDDDDYDDEDDDEVDDGE